MEINTKIKKYIEKIGVSTRKLALNSEMSPLTLYKSLKNNRILRIDEYLKICSALNVPNDYFLEK